MSSSSNPLAWTDRLANPYLHDVFAPTTREVTVEALPCVGEIPRDLNGTYLRNGPNPVHSPRGAYHWFDGDGMLHAVHFEDGRASYRSRWIRTLGFLEEARAGKALWPGYMDRPDPNAPRGSGSDGWLKDTANTDIVSHRGTALALWYQCGVPYRIEPRTLETLGPETFEETLPRQVSAHAKSDERTGELLFFDYATQEPYLVYHVVGKNGRVGHSVPIDVPGPRLPHDMAVTENHAILMDLPLFWDPELVARGVHKVRFFDEIPSRFAIVPRLGGPETVRWFEASPGYIYHVVNAWEDGDEIVMDACLTLDPCPPSDPADGPLARMMAFLRVNAHLHRWRFDLRTGETREEQLDDRNTEFPSIDVRRQGLKTRFAYNASIAREQTLLFDGIVKYNTETGRSEAYRFGDGWFGSESPFAPRDASLEEDDGYLLSFVSRGSGESEVLVLDAREISAGPVARIPIPTRVPTGFHACWVSSA